MTDDDVDATPAELLLEMLDLLTLAFPEPLQTAQIAFTASDDGERPAMTDLKGVARKNAPRRPDLGHGDAFVLDALNAVLVDLSRAFEREGGFVMRAGRIDVEGDEDGACWVYVIEGDHVRVKRRFDKSELQWLYFTPALFAALNDTEAREQEQQRALDADVARFRRFSIDMTAGTITFDDDAPRKFQLLGSWSERTQRFLWGHANDQIDDALKQGVEDLRRAATAPGLRAFTEPDVGCPEKMAQRLARHAAVRMGARGVYRAPFTSRDAKGFMYLALF